MSNYYPDDRNIKEIEKHVETLMAPIYIEPYRPVIPESMFDFDNLDDGIAWSKEKFPYSWQKPSLFS